MCRYLTVICLLLSLNACSWLQHNTLSVWLSNGKKYYLLPPLDSDKKLSLIKKMQIDYQGQIYVLQIYLEIHNKHMILLGLNPLGGKVFSIEFDGEQMKSSTNGLLKMNFKPEYLLADMQLIYWPEEKINSALNNQGFNLKTPTAQQRIIYLENKKLVEIVYRDNKSADEAKLWNSDVVYKNILRSYEYYISSQ